MPQIQEDPVLISSRREALIVFATWLIALIWAVSYCYRYGYISDISRISDPKSVQVKESAQPGGVPELWVDRGNGPERVKFLFGFPEWIFYGVALPWWICTAFSLFFGAYIVRDEDLGAEVEAADEPYAAPEEPGVQHA